VETQHRIFASATASGIPCNDSHPVVRVMDVPMVVDDPDPTGSCEETPAAESFSDFYEAQYRSVLTLAAALVGRWDVAEELVQDSFMALHARWARVSRYDAPDLWLRRVVLNRSRSTLRRRSTELRLLRRLARQRERAAEPSSSDDAVWRAVAALPKRQAQVMALMFVDDLSVTEIAALLECDENTVRTHYRRARIALASRLGLEEDGP
jgi:RNA polymerase sigma factor (sigma-70 family)